jgi:hypothetical protein
VKVLGPDIFTANGSGPGRQAPDLGVILTITAVLTGTGACTGTLQVEGSNNGTDWFAVGATIALTGTAPQSSSATRVQFSYAQYRHTASNITGTGATLTCHTGISS